MALVVKKEGNVFRCKDTTIPGPVGVATSMDGARIDLERKLKVIRRVKSKRATRAVNGHSEHSMNAHIKKMALEIMGMQPSDQFVTTMSRSSLSKGIEAEYSLNVINQAPKGYRPK